MPSKRYGVRRLLEVIVTSADEASEAETGGANRLELVRDLAIGGLTPSLEVIETVLRSVSVPVRVMLRARPSLELSSDEIPELAACARQIAAFPIDGLVIGAVKDGEPDIPAVQAILGDLDCRATFHRAFDEAANKVEAIAAIKQIPQIDRILTGAGPGTWAERKPRVLEWQAIASPEIRILVAAGLSHDALIAIPGSTSDFEFHVGRAAREGNTTFGKVRRELIARLLSRSE